MQTIPIGHYTKDWIHSINTYIGYDFSFWVM